jgi:hypothetical protein
MESRFPPGTQVRVRQVLHLRGKDAKTEINGTVEAWETLTTGSWHAHGKDGRLPLERLRLRKPDGELSLIVVDDSTWIERHAAQPGD